MNAKCGRSTDFLYRLMIDPSRRLVTPIRMIAICSQRLGCACLGATSRRSGWLGTLRELRHGGNVCSSALRSPNRLEISDRVNSHGLKFLNAYGRKKLIYSLFQTINLNAFCLTLTHTHTQGSAPYHGIPQNQDLFRFPRSSQFFSVMLFAEQREQPAKTTYSAIASNF